MNMALQIKFGLGRDGKAQSLILVTANGEIKAAKF
jgi:hypothetical protein